MHSGDPLSVSARRAALPASHTPTPIRTAGPQRAALRIAVSSLAFVLGCSPTTSSDGRDWAEIPIAGVGSEDNASLADLLVDPGAYRGTTVRLALRVVGSYRDGRGVWLRVVEAGAPVTSASVKLLIPDEGEEFLETVGRDMDLVARIERPTATMAYESAFEITPLAHMTRFSSSSRGGEDAAELRDHVGDRVGSGADDLSR